MMGLLFKNPYVAAGSVLAVLVLVAGLYGKGYLDGRESGRKQALEAAMTVKEKQDEVRNRRPDVPDVAVSLQQRRF